MTQSSAFRHILLEISLGRSLMKIKKQPTRNRYLGTSEVTLVTFDSWSLMTAYCVNP